MQTSVSGGRRLTVAVLAGREHALSEPRSVSRKELAAAARDAGKALSLRPPLRLVLAELVGCWGEEAVENRLIIWPSNEYLVDRTGLSERTVRYAVRDLIQIEVIGTKDSPNGKRFSRRDKNGGLTEAFGFDLTALYARRGEFVERIADLKALRDAQGRKFDQMTICRRASEEALSALRTHFPNVDTSALERELDELLKLTPRRGFMGQLGHLVDGWDDLRTRAEAAFYKAGNGGNRCRHKETDNGTPNEVCNRASEMEAGEPLTPGLIIEASPALAEHAGRKLTTMAEIIGAAQFCRASLGAHASVWSEAVETLGDIRAAAVVALVLQLHVDDVESGAHRIANPGGYLRQMVRLIGEGRIDLRAELLAVRKRHGS